MPTVAHPLRKFFSFAFVGAIGFLVDSGALYLITTFYGIDPVLARIPSFLMAVTVTWMLNSWLTFHSLIFSRARWLSYVSANALGFFFNFAIYALLTKLAGWPYLPALGVASLLALAVNFALSVKWVFRHTD